MPFAYGASRIAHTLKHISHSKLRRLDYHSSIAWSHIGARLAPSVFSSQKRITRRSAGRGYGVSIGEANTLVCQFVYIWCLHILCTIASQVAIAEVVGKNYDDVRMFFVYFCFLCHCRRTDKWRQKGNRNISLIHIGYC